MKIYKIITKRREVVKTHSAGGKEYKHPKKVKESFEERHEINDVANFLVARLTEESIETNIMVMAQWLAYLTIGNYRALEEILNQPKEWEWWEDSYVRYEIKEEEKY
jgi:hypothetical protein